MLPKVLKSIVILLKGSSINMLLQKYGGKKNAEAIMEWLSKEVKEGKEEL